jgi:hypothetical protein
MKFSRWCQLGAAIVVGVTVPAAMALVITSVAPFRHIDTARIAAVARAYPNATHEQRDAMQREIQSELHPRLQDMSMPQRIETLTQYLAYRAHKAVTAAAASTPSNAPFVGNETVVTNPSGGFVGLQRLSNCSLTLYEGPYSITGMASFELAQSTPSYEQTLHTLAGLTTQADVFSDGCTDPGLGIGSRLAANLGKTAQGSYIVARVGYNPIQNGQALFSATIDPNTMAMQTFSAPDNSMPAIAGLAFGDLNGDGIADVVGLDGSNGRIGVWLANADGTLATPTFYSLPGDLVEAAVVADVNGDGHLDVVAATRSLSGSGQEEIAVLTGNGDGTLNAAQSFDVTTPSGSMSGEKVTIASLIAADFRASAYPDVIASNGLVLLNNGQGSFTVGASAFPPSVATSNDGPNLAAADFNKDGKLDLAVGNGSQVNLYLGNGNGTFTAGNTYASIEDVGYLTATDLDGDGNTDLYVGLANSGVFVGDQFEYNQVYALMGNGDGSFQGAPNVPFVYTGSNLADLNGDHILDAVGVNADATFTSYLGDGNGNFSAHSTLTASPITIAGTPYTVSIDSYALGDINGDHHVDLAYIGSDFVGPSAAPGVFIALGDGQGGFGAPSFHAVPSTLAANDNNINWSIDNLYLADLNGDGKADLIYNYTTTSANFNTVYFGTVVQLGNGDGTFQAAQVIPYRSEAYSSTFNPMQTSYVALITDLNRDGIPDLVFLAQSSTIDSTLSTYVSSIQVALGKGDGTFSTPASVSGPDIMVQAFTDQIAPSIAVADMNGDGIPDLVALGAASGSYDAQIAIALGNGDGTFKAPTLLTSAAQYLNNDQGIAIADFNGDGKPDVVVTNPYDPLYSGIYLGDGDGSLQSAANSAPNLLINLSVGGTTGAPVLTLGGLPDLLSGSTELLTQANATSATPSFTLAATSSAASITAGQSASTTLTLAPTGSFDGTVSLSCSGLPSGATCMFTPASVAVNGAAATSALTITTTARTARNQRIVPGGVLLAAILIPLGVGRRRRHSLSQRCIYTIIMSLLMLGGCGGGGSSVGSAPPGGGMSASSSSGGSASGTAAGSYTVTISATAGSTTQTLSYSLTVS